MMKYGLLTVHAGNVTNIGDYIQGLASFQFLPRIDLFVNREELDEYEGDEIKMIMNGWFMHDAKHWPPSPRIKPLFVAFHLNSSVRNEMLSQSGISYLKKYEPIGCRDYHTVDLLKENGIDAYFSGCMTLTLGYKYKYYGNKRDGNCYIVDPYIPIRNSIGSYLKDFISLIKNPKLCAKIKKGLFEEKKGWRYYTRSARFVRLYSHIIKKHVIANATYMCQESSHYALDLNSDSSRLFEAKRLIDIYSKASLVITGRIHCSLPCLGLETPVLYTIDDNAEEISKCRFGGLSVLFNCIHIDNEIINTDFPINDRIGIDNVILNKDSWRVFARQLKETCINFVKSE